VALSDAESHRRIVELARALDIQQADLADLEASLASPPRTTEEVGFYVSTKNTDQENRYRMMVSRLSRAGRLLSEEDKYCHWLLEKFAEHTELPPAFKDAFGPLLDPSQGPEDSGAAVADLTAHIRDNYARGVHALERAFETQGQRLRTLWTAGGDTLYFVLVSPDVAEAWTNRVVAATHTGEPLGLRPPAWAAFYGHLGYAIGLSGDAPEGLQMPAWREG